MNDIENASTGETLDYEELEKQLTANLDEELSDLQFLKEDREQIGNPDSLGSTVLNVVWEQFVNQIGAVAGEDFIKENRGLTLDLRKEAHIQDPGNFERQKYATHNAYVDYQERGEEYRSNFYTDPNERPNAKQKQEQRYNEETKVWETYDNVDGEWKKTLRPDYRKPYEEDRNKDKKNKFGSKTVHKDHQVADATIARDPEAGAYMTLDEKVGAANSEDNLYDLDSAANQSKSDHDGEKWAKHKRTGKNGNGQTNAEYFGIDEEEYVEQDKRAKEAYEQKKKEKREEEVALGKKSQKEEAFRIGGKALRAAVMGLLASLIKTIMQKFIAWLRSKNKSFDSFIEQLKNAIKSFITDLKQNILTAGDTVGTTILSAIFGPVVSTIKKAWMFLKQGAKSLKEAVQYIKNPENQNKPVSILLVEVGKIVMAGATAAGAIVLGEVIEKGLSTIPGFGVEIPLIGSLANILGIFLGALVFGLIGALALNLMDRAISSIEKRNNTRQQINKGNDILNTQDKLLKVKHDKLVRTGESVTNSIHENHAVASTVIADAVKEMAEMHRHSENTKDEIEELLKALQES